MITISLNRSNENEIETFSSDESISDDDVSWNWNVSLFHDNDVLSKFEYWFIATINYILWKSIERDQEK